MRLMTDRYWSAIVAGGGQESVCWCKDKFGLSW